jgi:hypothetical protein
LVLQQKEGKLYVVLREGILEATKMGGGIMCNSDFILDECAKEFPVIFGEENGDILWKSRDDRFNDEDLLDVIIDWFLKYFIGDAKKP